MSITFKLHNWMNDLRKAKVNGESVIGDIDLRQLVIPTTHNSGCNFGFSDVACQNLTIYNQLMAGVRGLDIRVTHRRDVNGYYMHHNGIIHPDRTFQSGLDQISKFLSSTKGEVVLMFLCPGSEDFSAERDRVYGYGDRVRHVKKLVRDTLGEFMYKPNPAAPEIKPRHIGKRITITRGKNLKVSYQMNGGVAINGKLTLNTIFDENEKSRVLVFIKDLFSSDLDDSDFWFSNDLIMSSYNGLQAGFKLPPQEKGRELPFFVKGSLTKRDPNKFHMSDWTLWAGLLDGGIIGITEKYVRQCIWNFIANPGSTMFFRNTNLFNVDFVYPNQANAIINLNIPRYVSKVAVVVSDSHCNSPPNGYESYTLIPWDLNATAGGKFIYLCYQLSEDPKDAYTNFFISTAKTGGNVSHNSAIAEYECFEVDLNLWAGGDYLYLHGTKNDKCNAPIKRLFVSFENEWNRIRFLPCEHEEFVFYHNKLEIADCNSNTGKERIYLSMMRDGDESPVILYQAKNYSLEKLPALRLNLGSYLLADAKLKIFSSVGSIGSVKVATGYTVTLCKGDKFAGPYLKLTESRNEIPDEFAKNTRSIQVFEVPNKGNAVSPPQSPSNLNKV